VSGLSWTVALDGNRDFIGKPALVAEREAGPQRKLVGLVLSFVFSSSPSLPPHAANVKIPMSASSHSKRRIHTPLCNYSGNIHFKGG
jgi:hypothetical protein